MGCGQWYVRRGRIDRPTFWLHYVLPLFVVSFVTELVLMTAAVENARSTPARAVDGGLPGYSWILLLVWLVTLSPAVSSQVTRLHDRGHSARWLLFGLLPVAGPIVLLVQYCLPGEHGGNGYGPPPAPRDPGPELPYPTSWS
jgi:uncharacterized membrane protein YhaH (DUF805 family)